MISLKEWAGLLKKARIHEEMRQRTDATIRAAGSLLSAGERERSSRPGDQADH